MLKTDPTLPQAPPRGPPSEQSVTDHAQRATSGNYLNAAQAEQLLKGIHARRVNRDGKGFSHVEAYEIRAHLNRIFGFARWSEQVIKQELVFETQGEGKKGPTWTVCYRSLVMLSVHSPDGKHLATYTEGAMGDASNQPSRADAHDLALKTSQSQALKRAAVNLGDQFGLSLYNGGALAPIVGRTLLGGIDTAQPEVDGHITVLVREDAGEVDQERDTFQVTSPAPATPVDDAAELAAAEEVLTEELGAAKVDDAETDPVEWVARRVEEATSQAPAEAMQTLNKALEMAVRKQIRQKRLPNGSPETIGAVLTRLLAAVSRHVTSDTAA